MLSPKSNLAFLHFKNPFHLSNYTKSENINLHLFHSKHYHLDFYSQFSDRPEFFIQKIDLHVLH
jgi:hypothetical protein